VMDLNHDGSAATGSTTTLAFRWTAATGVVTIGTLPGHATSEGRSISGDGQVIVGTSTGSGHLAFRWTLAGGMQPLPPIPSGGPNSSGRGVSFNGERAYVVAGISWPPSFIWDSALGYEQIVLSFESQNNFPVGMSGAGDVVAGSSVTSASGSIIWRWTSAGGKESLGSGVARGLSKDGQAIFGVSEFPRQMLRWTAPSGVQLLGAYPGHDRTTAWAGNADGSILVGDAEITINAPASTDTAVIWSQATGLVSLETYLAGLGIGTNGMHLSIARAMSGDGRTIAGTGFRDEIEYGWMAVLPAPTTCYPNCDASTAPPVLNVADFTCFLQRFAAGESYANCDSSTALPVLNVADFTCFLQSFAAGCP
jgi:uncharacterized membrane protein